MIELRSDTFSLPTPEMLQAITMAPLGNDGYREDPTVNELERIAARMLGKEAACMMPSGTMGNLASLLAHSRQKENVALIGDRSDIWVYEREGAALCRGLDYKAVPTAHDSTLSLDDLGAAFERNAIDRGTRVSVVCLENPHNLNGGIPLPLTYIDEVAAFVHARGAGLHVDGARIFNAAVATRIAPERILREADSVQFCLSKSLAAPAGGIVAGSSDFIERVRGKRKVLGGTMRQSGVIAAAGIVALTQMVERLAEDHASARRLAEGLANIPGIRINLGAVQTNMVVFSVADERFTCETFIASARAHGVNLSEFKFERVRAAIHHGIGRAQISEALNVFRELMEAGPLEHAVYYAEAHG